jgi:hypothetical protein
MIVRPGLPFRARPWHPGGRGTVDRFRPVP